MSTLKNCRLSPRAFHLVELLGKGYRDFFKDDAMGDGIYIPQEVCDSEGEGAYAWEVRQMFKKLNNANTDMPWKFDYAKFTKMLAAKDHLPLAKALLAMHVADQDHGYAYNMTFSDALEYCDDDILFLADTIVKELEQFVAERA